MESLIQIINEFFSLKGNVEDAAYTLYSIYCRAENIPLLIEYLSFIFDKDTETQSKFYLALLMLQRTIKKNQDSMAVELADIIRDFSLDYIQKSHDKKTNELLIDLIKYGIFYGSSPWEKINSIFSSMDFTYLADLVYIYTTVYHIDPSVLYEEMRSRIEEEIHSENGFVGVFNFLFNMSLQIFKDPNCFDDYQNIIMEKLVYYAKTNYELFLSLLCSLVQIPSSFCSLIPPFEFFIESLPEIYSNHKTAPPFIRMCNKYLMMNDMNQDVLNNFLDFVIQTLPENYDNLSPGSIKYMIQKAGDEKALEIINEIACDTSSDGIRLTLFVISSAVKVLPIHEEYAEYLLSVFEAEDIQIRIEAAQVAELFLSLDSMRSSKAQLTLMNSFKEIIESNSLEGDELDRCCQTFTHVLINITSSSESTPDCVIIACAQLLEAIPEELLLTAADLGQIACFHLSPVDEVQTVQAEVLKALFNSESEIVRNVFLSVMCTFVDHGVPLPVFSEYIEHFFALIDACLASREYVDELIQGVSSIYVKIRNSDPSIVEAIIQRIPEIAEVAVPMESEIVSDSRLASRLWNLSLIVEYPGCEISPIVFACLSILKIICGSKDNKLDYVYQSISRIVNRVLPEQIENIFGDALSVIATQLNVLNLSNNYLFSIVADIMVRTGSPMLNIETEFSKESFPGLAIQRIADVMRTEFSKRYLSRGPMYYLITLLQFELPDCFLQSIADLCNSMIQLPTPEWALFTMGLLHPHVFQLLDEASATKAIEIAIGSITPDAPIAEGVIVAVSSALGQGTDGVLESAEGIQNILCANFQAMLENEQFDGAEVALGVMAAFFNYGAMGDAFVQSVFKRVVVLNQFAAPLVYHALLVLMDSDDSLRLQCLSYFGNFFTSNSSVSILDDMYEALRRLVVFRNENNGVSALKLKKDNENLLVKMLSNYEIQESEEE